MLVIDPVELPSKFTRRATGGPVRLTEVVTLADGREERNQVWRNSRRRWSLGGVIQTGDELDEIVEFYQARDGAARGFLWKEHTDFRSSRLGEAITRTDQVLGTGDGSETAFQLVKRYGSGGSAYDRPIRRPVAGTVVVGLDGAATTAFTLDEETGIVTMNAAPGVGVEVTAGFEFRVPVRFETDALEIGLELIAEGTGFDVPVVEVLP